MCQHGFLEQLQPLNQRPPTRSHGKGASAKCGNPGPGWLGRSPQLCTLRTLALQADCFSPVTRMRGLGPLLLVFVELEAKPWRLQQAKLNYLLSICSFKATSNTEKAEKRGLFRAAEWGRRANEEAQWPHPSPPLES